MDRQTDGMQHLTRHPREGRIINVFFTDKTDYIFNIKDRHLQTGMDTFIDRDINTKKADDISICIAEQHCDVSE